MIILLFLDNITIFQRWILSSRLVRRLKLYSHYLTIPGIYFFLQLILHHKFQIYPHTSLHQFSWKKWNVSLVEIFYPLNFDCVYVTYLLPACKRISSIQTAGPAVWRESCQHSLCLSIHMLFAVTAAGWAWSGMSPWTITWLAFWSHKSTTKDSYNIACNPLSLPTDYNKHTYMWKYVWNGKGIPASWVPSSLIWFTIHVLIFSCRHTHMLNVAKYGCQFTASD